MLIVPQVKGLHAFMEQAQRLRWIDYMLEHLAGPGFERMMPQNGCPIFWGRSMMHHIP
jgi:hypothetical protein